MGLSRRLFIGASLSAATASVMAGANVAEASATLAPAITEAVAALNDAPMKSRLDNPIISPLPERLIENLWVHS